MKQILTIIILFIVGGCSTNPYKTSNKTYKKQAKAYGKLLAKYPLSDSVTNSAYFVGTPNFNLRRPNFVILHHTAQNSCDQTLLTFTTAKSQVSAHYVICKDGTVHHMLNDYFRAWQAGVSKWGNATDINSLSVGIEIDNNGFEPFTEPQINSLLLLLDRLKKAYNIPAANFIGHADIAPTRKVDPSIFFPWKQLSDKGFGYWYSDTTGIIINSGFKNRDALKIIGYDITDSTAAIRAFRLHFLQDTLETLDTPAQKILFSLYKKYQ